MAGKFSFYDTPEARGDTVRRRTYRLKDLDAPRLDADKKLIATATWHRYNGEAAQYLGPIVNQHGPKDEGDQLIKWVQSCVATLDGNDRRVAEQEIESWKENRPHLFKVGDVVYIYNDKHEIDAITSVISIVNEGVIDWKWKARQYVVSLVCPFKEDTPWKASEKFMAVCDCRGVQLLDLSRRTQYDRLERDVRGLREQISQNMREFLFFLRQKTIGLLSEKNGAKRVTFNFDVTPIMFETWLRREGVPFEIKVNTFEWSPTIKEWKDFCRIDGRLERSIARKCNGRTVFTRSLVPTKLKVVWNIHTCVMVISTLVDVVDK